MAVNFKMSNSKKTIVIAILTIILLTVAVAGTVVFLKDRGSSEAADIDEMTYDNKTINDNNQTSSTDNTQEQISDEQNVEENNNANSVDNRNNINNTNNLVGNQTTSQTRQNTTASNQTDSIQESTIERVEQIDIPEQKISEEHHIGWTSMDVKPIVLSDTLKVSKLNIQKTSEIVGKENGEVAEKGDQIIYTISIENTGDVEKTTTVKDVKLQELIENGILKISEDSQEIAEKLISGMKVDIEAKSTKEIKFIAQILKIDGNIVNIARVGNEEVENKIDTYGLEVSKKLVNIERTGESIDINLPAKKNDVLTYEITLKNTGSTDVNNIDIKDNLPENLVTEDNVEFTNISIKAGEKIRKQIKATVQNVEGKIVNEVIVTDKENDKTLEPAIETIETIDMSIEKKAELIKAESNNNEDYSEFAEVGDKIKYTIILSNNGSVTLENVNIKDIMPEAEEKIITIKAGEKNLEVLAFEHKVIATDFEIDEVGKLKTIYNKAVATYEDEKDPENDITVDDEKEITVRDSYEYTVEYYYNNIKDESKHIHKQLSLQVV